MIPKKLWRNPVISRALHQLKPAGLKKIQVRLLDPYPRWTNAEIVLRALLEGPQSTLQLSKLVVSRSPLPVTHATVCDLRKRGYLLSKKCPPLLEASRPSEAATVFARAAEPTVKP